MWAETELSAPCRPHSCRLDASRRMRQLSASRFAIVKTVDQCFCGFEIVSFETLGEQIVHRRQELTCLFAPILVAQQPGEARGDAQFPGQSSLPARPTERLPVMIFGRRRGPGRALQQKKLAFDAQQLGNTPAVFIALGSRQRLVDCCESLGNLPSPTKPAGQLAKQPREVWLIAGLGKLLKSGAQML